MVENLPLFTGTDLGLYAAAASGSVLAFMEGWLFPYVLFHELGHFLAARLAGARVSTFCIGHGDVRWSMRRKGWATRLTLLSKSGGGHVGISLSDFQRLSRQQLGLIFAAGMLGEAVLLALVTWGVFPYLANIAVRGAFAGYLAMSLFSIVSTACGWTSDGQAIWSLLKGEYLGLVQARNLLEGQKILLRETLGAEQHTVMDECLHIYATGPFSIKVVLKTRVVTLSSVHLERYAVAGLSSDKSCIQTLQPLSAARM